MALGTVLLLTGLAGAAIPLGGLLAHTEHLKHGHLRDDILHGLMAFGGGALIAAVVLVLIPEGLEGPPAWAAFTAFLVGGVGASWGAHAIERRGTPAGQFAAMLVDFVPESIALGVAVAMDGEGAVLLALLIGLQNLPEGFNGYREVCSQIQERWGRHTTLWLMAGAAFLGPLAGIGGLALAGNPTVVALILMAASGGVLALVFQDIAPHAHRHGHMLPTLGALAGFSLGLAGDLWLA